MVATVPGVVTFGNLSFVDGTAVRKGQAILSLASSSLSDGNVAAKAKYAYENAKKEYERMETLIGDKIVSAKDFEQARLNYENAKVAWEAVAGKQTANGVSVVSPINGYLKNLQVKEGDYVTVGQPLATISQNSRLVLRAEVSEKYYNYLPSIQSANFRTPYDNVTYKLSDLRGRLLSYGKASDTNSFMFRLHSSLIIRELLFPARLSRSICLRLRCRMSSVSLFPPLSRSRVFIQSLFACMKKPIKGSCDIRCRQRLRSPDIERPECR